MASIGLAPLCHVGKMTREMCKQLLIKNLFFSSAVFGACCWTHVFCFDAIVILISTTIVRTFDNIVARVCGVVLALPGCIVDTWQHRRRGNRWGSTCSGAVIAGLFTSILCFDEVGILKPTTPLRVEGNIFASVFGVVLALPGYTINA